ncbi:hypothetical protein DZG01_28670 [Pseudomonas fluorescens]|nr:hypothetical protein DZG01_28670 [Pseudomonas fluorescens]
MAQRGYPGIHAGMPTAQRLRSAIVVNGAPKSTSTARRPDSRPGSCGVYTHQTCLSWTCGSKACSRGGLIADLLLRVYPIQLWERACSRRRRYIQH